MVDFALSIKIGVKIGLDNITGVLFMGIILLYLSYILIYIDVGALLSNKLIKLILLLIVCPVLLFFNLKAGSSK